MPQLNKGGKFVFGLSSIHDDLTVQFPKQALEEYRVLNDDKIIIFTGSKVTGGFCVTTYPLLSTSKLSHILHECPQLENQSIPQGALVTYKGRKYAWLVLKENGSIQFTPQLLEQLNLNVGDELLCIRSSAILHLQWAQKDHSLKKPIITMEISSDINGRKFDYGRLQKVIREHF